MSNFKLVKTAAALALGASVVTSAVATTDASAASKYKIKSGKLVYAKSGKVVKGYVTYKSTVYKNGSKLTGLKGKTYYKAGKKATGTYKGAYYVKGVKKVTTGTYNKAYYVKGVKKVTTGIYNKKYYKYGKVATGTYKGAYYVKGIKKVTTGTYAGSYYVKGVKIVSTGLYQDRLYQAGKLSKGYALYKSILYKDSYQNEGLTVFEGKLYDGVSLNKGLELFEGKLYNGSVLSTGFVKHDEKFYNNGELANGEFGGVEYKDGVVVKYEVKEVKAINASELKVTFSAPVDVESAETLSNYELKINNDTVNPIDAQISDNQTTVTLLLKEDHAFKSGDKYVIQTTNDIKNAAGKKLEKFVSSEQVFGESAAPSLVSVSKDSTNLVLTFDRPVSSKATSDITLAKIDGVAVDAKDLKPVNPTTDNADILGKAGSYSYTLAIQSNLQNDAAKVGTHDVVIYDVNDTTAVYPSKASVLKGSYTISNEAGIPEVKDTYAVNANRFFVETSEAVELTSASKVTVTKGTHEFSNVDGVTPLFNDALSATNTKVDATPGTYYDANGKTIYGVWVVVTDAAANDENPLYKNGETSATLNVTLENYVAKVGNKVGAKTSKTVTLNKNNTKPSINKEKNVFGTDKLTVQFNNDLSALTGSGTPTFAAGDVIVRDKDGVIVTTTGSVVSSTDSSQVEITGTFDASKAPYSVEFKKEKFRNKENTTSVKRYLVNTLKNDELTTTVGTKSVNFEYAQFALKTNKSNIVNGVEKGSVTNAGDYLVDKINGTITFKYAVEMSESARNASNYTLDGADLPTGSKVDFVGDKQTVRITLPEGSLSKTTSYKFGIKTSVTTKEGSKVVSSLQTKAPVELVIELQDTVSPELTSNGKYLVSVETIKPDTTTKQIELTFNEAIKLLDGKDATNDLKVVVNGSEQKVAKVEVITDSSVEDYNKKVIVTLVQAVNVNQAATVTVVAEEAQNGDKAMAIADASDNKLKAGSSTTVSAAKYSNSNAAFAALDAAKTELATEIGKVTVTKDGAAVKTIKIGTVTYTVSANASNETTAGKYVTADQATTLVEAIATAQSAHDAAAATVATVNAAKTTLTGAISTFERAAIEVTQAQANQRLVNAEAAKITADALGALTDSVNVKTKAQALVTAGYTVTIETSNNTAIATTGAVTQPEKTASDVTGNVTFKVEKNGVSQDVTISLTVNKKAA